MQINHQALIAVCAFSMVTGIAQANLITNPSFEAPTVPAGFYSLFSPGSAGIPDWSVTGPAGTSLAIVSTTFAGLGVTFEAQSGNQWLDLTGANSNTTDGVAQTVVTTAGTAYVLTFYIGNTSAGGSLGTTSTDALYINGSQVSTYSNSNANLTSLNWQQFTYDFTATGVSTTIGFVNLDPSSDNSNGLDTVDLEVASSTSASPEPSSIALLGSALAAITLLKRRNRSPEAS